MLKRSVPLVIAGIFLASGFTEQQQFKPKEPLKLTGKVDADTLKKTIQKAIDFLLKEKDGDCWTFDGPKVTGATRKIGLRATNICLTSIICMALSLHIQDLDKSNHELISKGLNYVLSNKPKKESNDNMNWTYPFVLSFLATQLKQETSGDMKDKIKDYMKYIVECAKLGESVKGGWEYIDKKPTTFVTSAILVGFYDAKSVGIEVPEKSIEKAVTSLDKGSKDDGGFTYYGMGGPKESKTISDPKGSMGRLGSCELSLFFAEKRTMDDLKKAADMFLANRGELDKVRGYTGTHMTKMYFNAAYYFLFGHYYMARLSRYLDDASRKNFTPYLQEVFVQIQESDGSWTDHPHSGKTYGAAMGLLALGEVVAPSLKK